MSELWQSQKPFSGLRQSMSRSKTKKEESQGERQAEASATRFFSRLRKRSVEIPSRSQILPANSSDQNNLHEKPVAKTTVNEAPPSPSTNAIPKEADSPINQTINQTTEFGALTRADIKCLFSGAPHFMIERGQHGRNFPQVLFPNNNDLDIADLQDRKFLRHESFALATLHAHLPIPDNLTYQSKTGLDALTTDYDRWNRPPFDVGVFEVPNMLGFEGKELGTIGMRHFLELPVTDARRSSSKDHQRGQSSRQHVGKRTGDECFEHLSHGQGYASIGKHAPKQERNLITQGGPKAWRRVGIRDFDMQIVGDRLQELSLVHEEMVSRGMKASALDKVSSQKLYNFLFTNLLFPPERVIDHQDPYSLKVQIEALVKVLTTPGVWIDFSLVKWRLRLGQIIFEFPGGPVDGEPGWEADAERRWLYMQIVLSLELLIRLDAALRIGMVDTLRDKIVTPHEMHHFNRLRNMKVDWDLILARRFLDHVQVRPCNTPAESPALYHTPSNGLFSRIKTRFSSRDVASPTGTFNSLLVPRRGHVQLEGLMRFARAIDWPNVDGWEKAMKAKFEQLTSSAASAETFYSTPPRSPVTVTRAHAFSHFDSHNGSDDGGPSVHLHRASTSNLGGWLSRSWLTGLVLPGESIAHILMASLLENDGEVIDKLGNVAILHGGFILDGRTFWSKACIVGRVAGCYNGGAECMGWVSSPGVKPIDENGRPFENGWVDVDIESAPVSRQHPRIEDGRKMAEDSSFLGPGERHVMASEFIMPQDWALDALPGIEVRFQSLRLKSVSSLPTVARNKTPQGMKATLAFKAVLPDAMEPREIELPLDYDVQFITAHPCRPPHGYTMSSIASMDDHARDERLPGHPLHVTYRYDLKSIADILDVSESGTSVPLTTADQQSRPWVIDARGAPDKDVLVRCWCAKNGRHALVARTGKVCLSCSVREARALEVAVVIRVGGEGESL